MRIAIEMLKRSDVFKALALGTVVAGGLVASRYLNARKTTPSERLADALLHTERLREALKFLELQPEKALAESAGFMVNLAYLAADGIGLAAGFEDIPNTNQVKVHPYTQAEARVLARDRYPEAEEGPNGLIRELTYQVMIPGVGEVRGIRTIGALKMSGISPARQVPDTLQINLGDEYTAQIETEFEVPESLFIGGIHVRGSMALRDNRGNAGRLHIDNDGMINGTITRDGRIIGRFEGKAAEGLSFQQYALPS